MQKPINKGNNYIVAAFIEPRILVNQLLYQQNTSFAYLFLHFINQIGDN